MGLLICAAFFVAMLTKSEVACVFLHSYTVKGCHHMRPTDLVSLQEQLQNDGVRMVHQVHQQLFSFPP